MGEEKNEFERLIINNLNLIYDEKVIGQRPNDLSVSCQLTHCGERYILDQSVESLTIGLGWELSGDLAEDDEVKSLKKGNKVADRPDEEDAVKMVEDQNKRAKNGKKKGKEVFELDIDVDGSVLVFGRPEMVENEQGDDEPDCDLLDIVNNNNGFYKTYVEYHANHRQDDDDNDEERFGVDLSKLNADNNEIGALCVLLNIFIDNNLQNKDNTNNITHCYVRLLDAKQDDKELCRFGLKDVNEDKKTTALALCHLSKLDNGCWAMQTNDVPLKKYSKIVSYEEYAKQIVLDTYDDDGVAPRGKCCACSIM